MEIENLNDKKQTIESKKLKILLISISTIWRYSNTGIDQLAGYLREKGYNVDIKYFHRRESFNNIIEEIGFEYDVYGFSVYSSNYENVNKICSTIKEKNSTSKICLGGAFPTRYYKEILNESKSVDFIVLGDGEESFDLLLENIMMGKIENFQNEHIASIYDSDNKKPFINKNISHLPAFDYYINNSKKRNSRKVHCLQTKNNICTGKCSFCTERKGSINFKNIDLIVNEIKYVAKSFGIKKFFFTDDNILDPNDEVAKNNLRKLCNKLQELNLNLVFECYVKATSLNDSKSDRELLKLMYDTGFTTLFVGLESGNTTDLKLYNKLTTVEDNLRTIRLIKSHNLFPLIGFININPYSTLSTLEENYYFLMKIESTNLFQYICSFLRVYKYTPIYDKMVDDKLISEDRNFLDDMGYEFKNKEVEELFNFTHKYLYDRVRNLDIELDWLYQYYYDCRRLNPECTIYDSELKEIKIKQFELMKEFFYKLLVKNDIEACKKEVDSFLSFFEHLQTRLMEIHRDLKRLSKF